MKSDYEKNLQARFDHLRSITHILFLSIVVLIIALTYLSPQLLVVANQGLSPITGIVSLIPYISWVANESSTPQVTEAYLTLLNLTFIGLFANLYWSTFPHFLGIPTKPYEISSNGYAQFLEEHVYGRQKPSISLDYLGRRMFIATRNSVIPKETFSSYKKLLTKLLENYEVRRFYLGIIAGSFLLLPWVAHKEVNSAALSFLSFRYVALLMTYFQIRMLFEAALLLSSIATKKIGESK